jgi:hypothetical protein
MRRLKAESRNGRHGGVRAGSDAIEGETVLLSRLMARSMIASLAGIRWRLRAPSNHWAVLFVDGG